VTLSHFGLAFVIVNSLLLLCLPRRFAPFPLLVGTCYMTLGQGINVGPFTFTVVRILILFGAVRVLLRRDPLLDRLNRLDMLIIIWAIWALTSSMFHVSPKKALILRLGLIYNVCGVYFLLRVFLREWEDLYTLITMITILLVPVAIEMSYEKVAVYNLFSILGGVSINPVIRGGMVRAQGPFAHPILAGTIGAVCLPFMAVLWSLRIKTAWVGIGACVLIVLCSGSSGPILSAAVGLAGLLLWPFRYRIRYIVVMVFGGYLVLDIIMKAPPYYLMARLNPTGRSTGWHRARLIQSALEHLNEWWFAGTDYTRHWMSTGVSWSPNHTDITNYYIKMGVIGGLPLTLLLIGLIVVGFVYTTRIVTTYNKQFSAVDKFMIWCFGASLLAHAATMLSVSYFDQSFVFFYMTLSAIASAYSLLLKGREAQK